MSDPAIFDRLAVVTGRDVLRPLRHMAEISEEIHALKSKAADIKGDLASYRAQFFGFDSSNHNHERKVMIAQIAEARRTEMAEAGDDKITESYLKSYAEAHPAYKSWLGEQQERRERMYRLEAQLAQIEADIEKLEGRRTVAIHASRIMEAVIYYAGHEMRMD